MFIRGNKAAMGFKPKTTGFEERDYERILARSNTLLSDPTLAEKSSDILKEETSTVKKVDPTKAKTLLEAIRARQGEVSARKGLTQTKTSLLG